MMTAVEAIAFKPKPSRPAPRGSAGVLGWLHGNLFYSRWSTVLTLAVGYVVVSLLLNFYGWAVTDAVWQADSRRECLDQSPHGACWAGLRVWMDAYIYGRYPELERWRVDVSFAVLVLWLLPLWLGRVRGRVMIGITAGLIFPFLGGYLLAGGERGWFIQVMVALAIVVFALNWLHVALCLWTQRSLASWLSRLGSAAEKSPRAQAVTLLSACAVLTAILGMLLSDWSVVGIRTNMWGGLFVTFIIAVVGVVVSLPAGILLALMRRSRMPFLRACVIAYIELVRSVPLITVLFFAVTMTPLFLPPEMAPNKLVLVLAAVSLFSAAYMAEVVRGGLQAVPLGQLEAAQSIGLGYGHTMGLIILPQALRHMIPNIASQYIGLFKDTTVVAIVGLYDFLLMLRVSGAHTVWIGLHIEPFVFGGAVYFSLCFAISRYSKSLESRAERGANVGIKPPW
jgi:general L-amino acid transport system permease protein